MSSSIEERVVQMKFDNDQFEKNANTTISTLGKLERSLKLDGATNGLKELMKVDFGGASLKGLVSSLEVTANKYSWFEQIAIGAYRKIGEAATSYLGRQVMDLTGVNQAISGWQKYENEIGSVQTIMNASGKSMKEVEGYLRKLSIYTDETSYSYDAMVQNIGKFNAAGVKDLNVATNAMMGIGNMAGYFGVNATKATHAMEGFAKAMGKGSMDSASWQWIETAGMNASDIQKAFMDTAVELGTIQKKGKKIYKTAKGTEFTVEQFKSTLSEKWLTKDVITETLNKYAAGMNDIIAKYEEFDGEVSIASILDQYGDQFDALTVKSFAAAQETKTFSDAIGALKEVTASGWRQSFKYIFGNYEEAKDMWGTFVEEAWDIFTASGNERNNLLEGWYKAGGRDTLLEGIANLWEGIKNIAAPIQKAWDKIFPKKTVDDLLSLTNKFKEFSEKFKNLFAVFDPEKNTLTKTVTEIAEVTERAYGPVAKTTKVLDKLAKAVIRGDYGNGEARKKALRDLGYSYELVQNRVNELIEIEKGWAKGTYIRHKVKEDPMIKVQKEIQKEVPLTEKEYRALVRTYDESASRAQKLTQVMEGLFSAMAIVKDVVKEIARESGRFLIETFRKSAPAIDSVVNAILKIATSVNGFYDNLKNTNGIQNVIRGISDALSTAIAAFANKAIPFAVENLMSFGRVLKNDVFPLIKSILDIGIDIIKKVWNKLTTGRGFKALSKSIDGIWETIRDIGKGAWNYIHNIFGSLSDVLTDFFNTLNGKNEKLSIGDIIAEVVDFAAKHISNFIDIALDFKNVIKDILGTVDISKVIGWLIRTALPKVLNLFTSIYNIFANQIYPVVKKVYDVSSNFIKDVWKSITSGSGFSKLGKALEGVWETVKEIGGIVWETLKRVGGDLWENIEKIVRALTGATEEMTIGEVIGLVFDKIADKLAGFISTIGTAKDKVLEFFRAFAGPDAEKVETLTASMSDVSETFSETTQKTLNPVKDTLDKILGILTEFGNKLKNPVKLVTDAIDSVVTSITGAFKGLTIEGIGNVLKNSGIGVFFGILAKKIAEGKTSIDSIPTNFNKVLMGIYDTLNLYQSNLKGTALKQAAEAIAILTVAVIALSAVDIDTQKIADIAASMALLLWAGATVIKALNKWREITNKAKDTTVKIDGLKEFLEKSKFSVHLTNAVKELVKPFDTFLGSMAKAFDKKLNGGQLAKAFLFVSAGLAIIVQIIKTIRDEHWDLTVFDEAGNPTYFGQILLFIGGVGLVMSALIRLAGGKQTMGAALTFITSVYAIKMLVDYMMKIVDTESFSKEKISKLLGVFLFIFGVLTTLAFAIGASSKEMSDSSLTGKDGSVFTKKTKSGNSPLGIAAALIALAVAFNLMIPVINTFGALPKEGVDGLLSFIVIFGGVIAGLSWLSKYLGNNKDGTKAISKIAWSMVGALMAIGLVVKMLDKQAISGKTFLGMMGLIIALAGAIGLLAGIATVLDGDALVKIGEGMLKFGVGLLAVAAAGWVFGKAIKDIVDGFMYLGEVMSDPKTADKFREGVAVIVLAIISAIIIHKSGIITAVADFLGSAVNFLLKNVKTVAKSIFSFISKIFGILTSNTFGWIVLIGGLLTLLLSVAGKLLPGFVHDLVNFICIAINTLAYTISTQGGAILLAFLNLGTSIVVMVLKGITQAIDSYVDSHGGAVLHPLLSGLSGALHGAIDEWDTDIQDEISRLQNDNSKLQETVDDAKEIQDQIDELEARQGQNSNFSNGTTGDVTQRNPLTAGIGSAFSMFTGGNNFQFDATGIMQSMLSNKDGITGAAGEMMSGVPTEIQQYLDDAGVEVDTSMLEMMGLISSHKEETAVAAGDVAAEASQRAADNIEISEPVEQETQEAIEAYENKIISEEEKAAYLANHHIVQPTAAGASQLTPELEKVADYAIDGFVNKIASRENYGKLWSAGSGVAKTFMTAYDVTSHTESPSKEMMWRGDMAILGLVNATYNGLNNVWDAGTAIATSLVDAVSQSLDMDLDTTPVITPVMDLSNVSSGIGTIGSYFGKKTFSAGVGDLAAATANLSTSLASKTFDGFNQNQILKQNATEVLNANNADLITQLAGLRTDVTALNDSMLNTQVVLDSGALVGATAKQMDNALGRFKTLKGRGI